MFCLRECGSMWSSRYLAIPLLMTNLSFGHADYRPVTIETADGTVLTDYSAKPPDTVYVTGVKE